jgi:hypothetical protein
MTPDSLSSYQKKCKHEFASVYLLEIKIPVQECVLCGKVEPLENKVFS